MRNAQAKLDALLEALINRAQAGIGADDNGWETPPRWREEVKWLIEMSNLNQQQLARTGRPPGPSAKPADETTDADLLKELMKGRDPENFPRRGPPNGKRASLAPPPGDSNSEQKQPS